MSLVTANSSSRRKRAATDLALLDDRLSTKPRRDSVLQVEIDSLQAELEHERSLRVLDAKRFLQTQQRLEKQLEFSAQETVQAKAMMQEMEESSEQHVEQLKRALARTKDQLRATQEELEEERAYAASSATREDPRVSKLQTDLVAQKEENEGLKGTITELQTELQKVMKQNERETATSFKNQDISVGAASEARPDILRELNRVRILLAESERKNRQTKRAQEELALKSKQLIHEKERLRSANKRIEQMEGELKKDVRKDATAAAELSKLKEEHKVVLEKFGKLRDAVYEERRKAEEAGARADAAEALAGKGSFDPENTRVLHLSNNPLTEALKEEVKVLKRQVQVLSDHGSNRTKKGTLNAGAEDVDPNKLHQRLKQSFKEQIGRFREGVYLMTGFKIDMIPGPDDERFKFKVRSVFARHEGDHLMFQWPEGKKVTSLDLLDTEHAKALTKTPAYQYITKCHSLPAFLASAQLALFEKQTMM